MGGRRSFSHLHRFAKRTIRADCDGDFARRKSALAGGDSWLGYLFKRTYLAEVFDPGVNPAEPGTIAVYRFTERTGNKLHNAALAGPDLEIPKNFMAPHKAMLTSPVKEFHATWGYVKDILLNVRDSFR
jgi:hypothetical protein